MVGMMCMMSMANTVYGEGESGEGEHGEYIYMIPW